MSALNYRTSVSSENVAVISHCHHVVTLHVRFVLILALIVELAEEVEGHHSVQVHNYGQQTHRHQQLRNTGEQVKRSVNVTRRLVIITWSRSDLFAVVSDRGQDGAQGFHTHGDVQEMSSKEEVVIVSQQRHQHVPDQVEEGLKVDVEPVLESHSLSKIPQTFQ